MRIITRLWRYSLMVVVAAAGWEPGFGETPAPASGADWPELRNRTFSLVWDTVNEAYYDPDFGGVDWTAQREKYAVWLPEVEDNNQLRSLLVAMLGELQRTHFSILPREMAVYTPEERGRMGTAGVQVAYVEGMVVVKATKPQANGRLPGVRPGDVINSVDDVAIEPLQKRLQEMNVPPARCGLYLTQLVTSRLRSEVGSTLTLVVQGIGEAEREVKLTVETYEGEWSDPMGDFPSQPIECTVSTGGDGLAYLHFNFFGRQIMKEIRPFLRSLPVAGGLVIDLRGNPGGITLMAAGISGWLTDRDYLLATMRLRQGHIGFTVNPQEQAFLGPLAILVDSQSASTSEIMAAGLQEAGRARIFGEQTPGAALPSLYKELPTGDLFQYAIADLQTPAGILIEGRGVSPDETVLPTRDDLAAGRDPVLAAARRWLKSRQSPPVPAAALSDNP